MIYGICQENKKGILHTDFEDQFCRRKINVKHYFKNKKRKSGATAIETVIGGLLFIIIFTGICDFLLISNRYLSLTDTTKELARTLSVQGGALKLKPPAYSANYYNIEELASVVKKQMNGMGFEDCEYSVFITYSKIYDEDAEQSIERNSTERIIGMKDDNTYGALKPTEKIDYLSDFSVRVVASYDWPFINSLWDVKPTVIEISMPGVSEWRYGYDGWESEG